jgi:hypothetical protein
LPVGHTHEDIDASFGTIASWFDRNSIQTPQQYKAAIESAFKGGKGPKGSKLKVAVKDVFIVPDYQDFFGAAIDPHFGRLWKQEFTQHQLRFEAVKIDVVKNYFPFGAKFTYRKFCNDEVTLIDKKPILLCRTEVGRLTGRAPTVYL